MTKHLSLASRILLTPLRNGLRAGQGNTVDVLVRVQAPDAPEANAPVRPPQAIALVIDRSGSMSGHPLAEAKRCAEFVVSRMRPTDSVSVVQFDSRVQRLWPAMPMGCGDAVRGAISRIEAGGSTNLHGGWLEGADTLAHVPGSGLKRVILLSDGCANEGLTDEAQIAAQCAEWVARGITTSTYGLGRNFNEELMVAMASAGSGSNYYGDSAEDLLEPFQQELDLLANLALRQVELSVSVPDGLQAEVLNQLPRVGSGWRLPDLAWGAEAWAIVRVTAPEGAIPAIGDSLTVLRVSVAGLSLKGEPLALEKAVLALAVLSPAEFDALAQDALCARRLVEIEAGKALLQMRMAAEAGDWATVDRLLAEAQARFSDNEWVANIIAAMTELARSRSRERMMKEAMYSSSKLRHRLAARDEASSVQFSVDGAEPPAYLRRKPLQGKKDL